MSSISKAWNWNEVKSQVWMNPSEESYYIANRWKKSGYSKLLDFGCGLGRHSIFFAKEGFDVSAFDLSTDGVHHLTNWAKRENIQINAMVADMLQLPFDNDSFDCLFAYHVISHTDTKHFLLALEEIKRILRPGGEFYLTLCSKESWSFKEANFPKIDENTVRRTADGPEKDVPHFYVDLDDIIILLKDFSIISIRHTDDCYFDGQKYNSKHYFVLGQA